jgi:O-antigen ligase
MSVINRLISWLDINKAMLVLALGGMLISIQLTHLSYKVSVAILLLILLLLLTARVGTLYLFLIFAAFYWFDVSFNYYFLSNILSNANIFQVGILGAFLAYLFTPFGDINIRWARLASTPGFWALLGFVIASIIAYYTGPFPRTQDTFIYLRQVAIYAPAIYLLISTMVSKPKHVINILMALILGSLWYSLQLSFRIGGAWEIMPRLLGTRGPGFYGFGSSLPDMGPVQVGTYISLILPLSVTFSINARRIFGTILFGSVSIIFIMMILLAEGRASWLASITSVFLVAILSFNWKSSSKLKVILLICAIVIVLITIIRIEILPQTFYSRLSSLAQMSNESSVTGRIDLWKMLLPEWIKYPFGIGFQYPFIDIGMTAHNELLQMGLGSGFVGLSFFLIFFGGIIKKILHLLRKNAEYDIRIVSIAVLGCLVSYVINGITDNPSANSIWSWQVIWIVLAAGAIIIRAKTPIIRGYRKSVNYVNTISVRNKTF